MSITLKKLQLKQTQTEKDNRHTQTDAQTI